MQNISVIDVFLILIMLANIIMGIRLGFVKALLTFVRFIAAFLLAKIYSVKLTDYIIANTNWETSISQRISETIAKVLEKNPTAQGWQESVKLDKLPPMLESYIEELLNRAGNSLEQFTDYLSNNLSRVTLQIVSFVAIFAAVLVVVQLLIAILDSLSQLPILNTANRFGGFLVGVVKGILYCFLFSTLLYLANMLGMSSLSNAINTSMLIKYFYFGYLFT